MTILHQHAIQGDINGLQSAVLKWNVFLLKSFEKQVDMEIIYASLRDLERDWERSLLSNSEIELLGESFSLFVEVNLERIKSQQLNTANKSKIEKKNFEYTLRSLSYLSEMKAFAGCCPFHKDIRAELVLNIKKGVSDR